MNLFEQGLSHYLTKEQHRKIQSVNIGIGGAGGLGSNLAVILTRCGFQNFEILDSDTVEPSNLNRQFYFIDEINQVKVEALKQHLVRINPDVHIATHNIQWTENIADRYFRNCPIIAEALDLALWKRQFIEFYQTKAELVVAGMGMAGLLVDKEIRIKKMDNVYLVGDFTTDANQDNPPMAPRVMICAARMAEVILGFVLRNPLPNTTKLYLNS